IFDCSTGSLTDELARRGVNELLYPEPASAAAPPAAVKAAADALNIPCTPRPGWQFRTAESLEAIQEQYGVATLAGFGLTMDDPALPAAGAIIRYLRETQTVSDEAAGRAVRKATLAHLQPPKREDSSGTCVLDA